MTYLVSLLKGIAALIGAGLITYYGLGILDRSPHGFIGSVLELVFFLLLIYSAAYIAEKITLNKLGSFGHTIVTLLVLMCFSGIYRFNMHKRRLASYQNTAVTLGLEYHENFKLPLALAKNPALQRGFMPEVKKAFTREYHGVDIIIFSYYYEELSSDYPDHYLRTAVAFSCSKNNLPEFYLVPRGLFDRFFTRRGIYFKEDPKFSKRYSLTGPDENAVRRVFGSRQRQALLEMKRKWAVGFAEGYLVIYADEEMDEEVKTTPKEMGAYLEKTWFLFDALCSATGTS